MTCDQKNLAEICPRWVAFAAEIWYTCGLRYEHLLDGGGLPSGRTASVVNGVSSILFSAGNPALAAAARYAALDRFVAGPENRLVCIAADSVLQGTFDFNPLIISGPSGSGKTHLAQGLARAFLQSCSGSHDRASDLAVCTGSEFAQQFARAIHEESVPVFRERYRTSKFMVLEDLQSLSGKPAAQQELLHTLDVLLDAGARVIATCREPLPRANWLMAGLRSRLMPGLEVPLAWPELAARTVLIEELAAARGTQISKSAIRALAEAVRGSVPELLGALTSLESARLNVAAAITHVDVQAYLLRRKPQRSMSLHNLSMLTARHFGLKVSELKSQSRERSVVLARDVAMYLARQATNKTLIEIGSFFGGRDHSTVLHGCRQVERLVQSDAQTRLAVESLQAELDHGRPVRIACGKLV
jgi:chromosomal replication initiator protein